MQIQKKCGKNLSKVNNGLFLIFLLTLLSRVGTNGVFIVLVIQLFELDNSGASSSIINLLFLLGASLIGIFGAKFINKYKGFKIGFYSPLVGACLCVFFIIIEQKDIGIYYTFAVLISLLSSLENPNNNAIIPEIIENELKISKYYSIHQTIDYILLLCLPILINYTIKYISYEFTYIILAIFFLLGAMPWLIIRNHIFVEKNEISKNTFKDVFRGYFIIYNDKSLFFLNLTRIFYSFVFSVIAASIPFFISYLSGGDENKIINLRTFYEIFVSTSFIVVSILFAIKLLDNKHTIKAMTLFTPIVVLVAYMSFYTTKTTLFFYVLGISLGIGQYLGRISTITIGQRITKKSDLPLVILSGDTVTRVFTLIITSLMILLLKNENHYLFEVVGCSCIIGLISLITITAPLKKFYTEENKIESNR